MSHQCKLDISGELCPPNRIMDSDAFSTWINRPLDDDTNALFYRVQYSVNTISLVAGPFITLFLLWIILHPNCKKFSSRVYDFTIFFVFARAISTQIIGYMATDVTWAVFHYKSLLWEGRCFGTTLWKYFLCFFLFLSCYSFHHSSWYPIS